MGTRRGWGEDGFTLTESLVALSLLSVVILALLGTMNSGIRGILIGRQRNAASAVAQERLEGVRAASYERIGHDLDGDTTLDSDPAVVGDPLEYTGFDEQLVDGGADPAVPVHELSGTLDGTDYEAHVYVTHVEDEQPYKRVTVVVDTLSASGAADDHVRLSTFVYDSAGSSGDDTAGGGDPDPDDPDPDEEAAIGAEATADAGAITVTGELDPPETTGIDMAFPLAGGALSTTNFSEVSGSTRSAFLEVDDTSGLLSGPAGCATSASGVSCPSVTAATNADDDPTRGYDESETDSATGPSGPVGVSGVWGLEWDPGAVESGSSACYAAGGSCGAAFGFSAPDHLPYGLHEGDGPQDVGIPFETAAPFGTIEGSLVTFAGAVHAGAETDEDSTGAGSANRLTTARAETEFPPVDVVTLDGAGLAGADVTLVQVAAASVAAQAQVGPTASMPSVSGDDVEVTLYGLPPLTVDPGAALDSGELTASLTTLTWRADATVSVVARAASTDHTTDASGTIVDAEAQVEDWLRITVDLEIRTTTGATLVDTRIVLAYGDLAASARHTV